MAETNVEFNEEKAGGYDDHPMVKAFPPVFRKLLDSWDWYNASQPLNILDFGCGTGLNSFEFAKQGHVVTAADVSPHMLDVFRNKLEASPVLNKELISVVQVAPPSEDEWWNSLPSDYFDVIFMIAVLHHVAAEQQEGVLVQLSKLLKAGGRICILEFEDTERSRAARGSFHHHQSDHHHHDHEHHHHHHSDERHNCDNDNDHHHHHDHLKHDVTRTDHDEKVHQPEAGSGHEHAWLSRDVMTRILLQSGLTVPGEELFAVNFENGQTMDCFAMIGTRDS